MSTAPTVTFSSIPEQVHAVRQTGGCSLLPHLAWLHVEGPDALPFLQNQTTNDVAVLALGQGQPSAILDRKANILAVFTLCRFSETRYGLLTHREQAQTLLERLEAFHFTEDLTISDASAQFTFFTLQGPEILTALSKLFDALPEHCFAPNEYGITMQTLDDFPVRLLRQSLTGEIGVIMCVETHHAKAFAQRLSAIMTELNWPQLSDEALDVLRVEAGLPAWGSELRPDVMLPQTGLEQTHVSETKGCYPGQEVVAKVKTYGGVPKALVGLVFKDKGPLQDIFPQDMTITDQVVGTLTRCVESPTMNAVIAMAYLDRASRIPGQSLTFSIQNTPYTAQVVTLPFYRASSCQEQAKTRYETALDCFAHNREAEAIRLLHQALALDPLLMDAYESLGVILGRQGHLDDAIALMQRLAELDPTAVMPHTNLSVFYMQKGLKDDAETEKAIATTLSFKNAMAAGTQANAQAQRRQALEQKIAMFNEVLDLDPEDALAHYGLGAAYNELSRYAQAIPHLQKAVALNPRQSVAYLALAQALVQTAQPQQAHPVLQAGITMASQRGDLIPLQAMQQLLGKLL